MPAAVGTGNAGAAVAAGSCGAGFAAAAGILILDFTADRRFATGFDFTVGLRVSRGAGGVRG
jgi:hypothetical protein